MKEVNFTIERNYKVAENPVAGDVYRIVLAGDTSDITRPGQFVNISIPGRYLRRPISVNDVSEDALTLLYRVVGTGTDDLSKMKPGEMLNILSGLGNGFDVSLCGTCPVLVSGGLGTAPLYLLARRLIEASPAESVRVILGFKNRSEVLYRREFEKLGCEVTVATEDGSMGVRGFVTDALKEIGEYSSLYSCGPYPMFRALHKAIRPDVPAWFSLEERMGCGFGACMGCSIQTKQGPKRVCKDGPVFSAMDLIWD